ncbi:MAG: tetratricopeptide repeat protein [Methylococcales bacterium]|nr:tetratricopeptide repeat protein [Methylococcales bacterium]
MAEELNKEAIKILKTPPYIGLRPFERTDKALFFERDDCVIEILALLETTKFLTIIGEAHSGKTSITKCGLENWILENNTKIPDRKWHIASFRPSLNPYSQLTDALLEPDALGEGFIHHFDTKEYAQKFLNHNLTFGSHSLHSILSHKPIPTGHKLLLICDQFEDLFHLWEKKPTLANDIVNLLIDSSYPAPFKKKTSKDIFVIINLRSSFLNSVPVFPKLEQIIQKRLYLPPHLTEEQLKKIINKPLKVARTRLAAALKKQADIIKLKKITPAEAEIAKIYKTSVKESEDHYKNEADKKKKKTAPKKPVKKKETISDATPELLKVILKDIKNKKDQLPLLQHILRRMWDLDFVSGEHHFEEPLYGKSEISSINQSLDAHLEQTYYTLEGKQPHIAEVLFRQMTLSQKTAQPPILHFPVKLKLVADLSGSAIKDVIAVVDIFRTLERGFLIPALPIKLTEKMDVDIAHDVVVIYWKRIKDWQKKEVEAQKNYVRLNTAVKAYKEKKGDLLRGGEIKKIWAWSRKDPFNKVWAKHYKCDFDKIKPYLEKSQFQSQNFKYFLYGVIAFIICVLGVGVFKFYQEQVREDDSLEALKMIKRESIRPSNRDAIEKMFKKLIKRKPNNPYAWMYVGIALKQQGRIGEAEEALRTANDLLPDNSEILLELSKLLIEKKEYTDAYKFLKEASNNIGNNYEEDILEYLGDALIRKEGLQRSKEQQKEDWEEAVEHYKDALDYSPNNDIVLNKLGQALSLLEKNEEALEMLEKAREYNRNSVEHRRVYGVILLKMKRFPDAIKAFQLTVDLEGNIDENSRNLGIAYFYNKQFKMAVAAFQSAVKLKQDNEDNHRYLGDTFMKQKKFEEARMAYENARNITPSKVNLMNNARALEKLKRFDEANNLNAIAATLKDNKNLPEINFE